MLNISTDLIDKDRRALFSISISCTGTDRKQIEEESMKDLFIKKAKEIIAKKHIEELDSSSEKDKLAKELQQSFIEIINKRNIAATIDELYFSKLLLQ